MSSSRKIQIEVYVKVSELAGLPGYSKITLTNPNLEDELTVIARNTAVEDTITNLDISLTGNIKTVIGLASELLKK